MTTGAGKFVVTLLTKHDRDRAARAVDRAPDGYRVTFEEPKRSTEQNKRMWALLSDISRQVEYYGDYRSPEAWKDIFSAALREVNTVPSLDGKGIVQIGLRTSKLSKTEMGDLMTLIEEYGARNGVTFGDERSAA